MRYLLVLFSALACHFLSAQQNLPVIRANTKDVKIEDGLNFKSDYWVIFPETKPDIYYLDIPRKNTHLNFFTDIDSISFDMKFGEVRDFIVLLNGKDSCYTQISATYPNLKKPNKANEANDTIPFTLVDNRIYFKGKINGSAPLNIQFDLGADAVNINKKSAKRINIAFDKKGFLINSDGTNETKVSSSNEFEIEGLKWHDIEMYETKNMKNHEDVIIGNGFFLDQIYQIDYEKNIIIIYNKRPEIESGFIKQDMILDNGVRPVIKGTFLFDETPYTEWFLFDTGNTGNGIVGNKFLMKYGLYDKFSNIISFGGKKFAFIPLLIIGEQTISEGVITLEKQKESGSDFKFGGLIGNKILKRFNIIIDNREGYIYLKRNTYFEKNAYGSKPFFFVILALLSALLMLLLRKYKLKNEKTDLFGKNLINFAKVKTNGEVFFSILAKMISRLNEPFYQFAKNLKTKAASNSLT